MKRESFKKTHRRMLEREGLVAKGEKGFVIIALLILVEIISCYLIYQAQHQPPPQPPPHSDVFER